MGGGGEGRRRGEGVDARVLEFINLNYNYVGLVKCMGQNSNINAEIVPL